MGFRFGVYAFDDERGLEGPAGRIPLRPKDARLLAVLLSADGRTVSKDAIIDTVWNDRVVTEDSITQAVRRLRSALPPSGGQQIVQTVYGSGVRIGVQIARGSVDASPPSAIAASASVEATACLTSAREIAARRRPRDFDAAVQVAQRAVELDPNFVAGWCALADLHVLRAGRMIAPPREAGACAVEAAERALQVDGRCAPALAARGWVRAVVELDVANGIGDFEASLRCDPRYWFARALHAWALVAAGRVGEAVAEIRASVELNPWAGWTSGGLGQYLYFAGDAEAGLREVRAAAQRFPDLEISQQQLSLVTSGVGLHDEAISAGRRAVELAPETPLVHSALACALARAGRRREARLQIQTIESMSLPAAGTWLASAHLALGQRERAIESLRVARQIGAPQFVYAFVDPRLEPLHGDAAFERLRPSPRGGQARKSLKQASL